MLTVERAVYYCEFCKRHRLTKHSIETHEPKCIYNPDRSCGWHDAHITVPRAGDLAPTFKENLDTDWLHDEVNGCPACMLAVVVQAQLTFEERDATKFDYKAEVERFRKEEQEERYGDRW